MTTAKQISDKTCNHKEDQDEDERNEKSKEKKLSRISHMPATIRSKRESDADRCARIE